MKIGIYGGTFDPPHNGHVNACKSFVNAIQMDKLYVIPTSIPPHKQRESSVSGDDRYEMARLAFSEISDKIELSRIELERSGKSYTADTLRYFKAQGAKEIFLLCGTDMLVTLDEWYDFEYIFRSATIVYIRRESDQYYDSLIQTKIQEFRALYGAKILEIVADVIELSSSDIRNGIDDPKIKELIPISVYEFIMERGLYKND
ncbi:MAG: nicotinate (nicotinamide) nucleotide adenylyltransferase [Clostridia bacterium]|nr:nicotinate (nicotinamide) nucleotide adenylyltransferase [Clostridia bacterium]